MLEWQTGTHAGRACATAQASGFILWAGYDEQRGWYASTVTAGRFDKGFARTDDHATLDEAKAAAETVSAAMRHVLDQQRATRGVKP